MRTTLLLLVILSLSFGVAGQSDASCALDVTTVLETIETLCEGLSRNQVCYGNNSVRAEQQPDVTDFEFESPGDIVNVVDLQKIYLSPMDDEEAWGVALMQLQANLPDTLPGENVTVVLFGDVELETDGDRPMQAFYFRSGIGDTECSEAPNSGMLIQTPEGKGTVELAINEVNISLGSTAFLQADLGYFLYVYVLEGQATVEAFDVEVIAVSGSIVMIPIDKDLKASGQPSEPQPLWGAVIQHVPIVLLPEQSVVAELLEDYLGYELNATYNVSATSPWTRTNILLHKGQAFTLSVSGSVNSCINGDDCPEGHNQWVSATGIPGNSCGDCQVTGVPEMSAVGRVGSGDPFYVGNGGTFTAENTGLLQLGVNDGIFDDNGGSFSITVSTQPSN